MTNPRATSHSVGKKSISLKIRNKTGMFASPLLFNLVLEVLVTAIRQEEIKGIQIGMEEVKVSLFADDIEKPKDFTKKLRELINEFSKVAGYKINIQKSAAFLYANNELTEKEIKKNNHVNNCFKKNKILRNKFIQRYKRSVLRK